MMTFKDGVRQIVELPPAGLALIALSGHLSRVKPAFGHVCRATRRAMHAFQPPQLTNHLEALGVINEILNVDHRRDTHLERISAGGMPVIRHPARARGLVPLILADL